MKIKNRLGYLIARGLRALGINTPGLTSYFAFGGGTGTAAGVTVNEHNALTISAVYQCVRYISDSVAQLPISIYKRVERGREEAINHPLYRVLHVAPNPLMPLTVFKKTLQDHVTLWGNAFAEVERNGGGNVVALWPLRPDSMRLQLFNGKKYFYYRMPNGEERQLTDVLHLIGHSDDGIIGYSVIAKQREKLGLAKAAETYRARFFANDARPGGVLQTDKVLSDVAYNRLEKNWMEKHQGLSNRDRMAILEEGLKWQDVGVPPDEAQFLEGEEFTKADIAGIFGVPPYKIGLLKAGTVSYASVEQQAIDADSECIGPWIKCWEDSMNLMLLTPTEQRIYFTKFNINALMRADSQARAHYYQTLFDRGVLTINDILRLEDMNTIGPDGDRRFIPLNVVPLDRIDDVLDAKQKPTEPPFPKPNGAAGEPAQPKLMNGAAH